MDESVNKPPFFIARMKNWELCWSRLWLLIGKVWRGSISPLLGSSLLVNLLLLLLFLFLVVILCVCCCCCDLERRCQVNGSSLNCTQLQNVSQNRKCALEFEDSAFRKTSSYWYLFFTLFIQVICSVDWRALQRLMTLMTVEGVEIYIQERIHLFYSASLSSNFVEHVYSWYLTESCWFVKKRISSVDVSLRVGTVSAAWKQEAIIGCW